MNSIIIGCLVGVVSSATQSVGLTLQRKSHIEAGEGPGRGPVHRRALWQIGLALFLLSNVLGSSVQITTLPLIVLSPLQAVGLVFNSICASIILEEPFTQLSLVGTVLVTMGAFIIAGFGATPEPELDLDKLLQLLHRRQFVVWMCISIMIVIAVLICIRMISAIYQHGSASSAAHQWGWTASNEWLFKPSKVFQRVGSHPYSLKGLLYGVVSGILSAHSLLMAKSAVELLVAGISDRWKDYFRWQSWVIVLMFLTFAILQLYFLNRGLRLCSTSVLYPLVFCIFNITTILNGLIYFQQASRLSLSQIWMVVCGTLLVLLGVLCLSWRLEHSQNPEYNAVTSVTENQIASPFPDETSPLIIRRRPDDYPDQYTSFCNINEGAIPEPTSPYSGRKVRGRTLSLEQSEILDQIRKG